ncbi:alpha/beta hydrolase [Gandjariella thermophila]|uniref:Acyl-CoA:diacylglycerol acyltransferase n=1 Tax=Gandjariella thermophila TaxID=1931992 RepID=A0A4D4JC50_9PSEU|nr:alpha/beta hydrolase-fold protein [Gandjariella thermophila]GDY31487.1 esterase [Gandjariella thermophila]
MDDGDRPAARPRLGRRTLLAAAGITGIAVSGLAASATRAPNPGGATVRRALEAAGSAVTGYRPVTRVEQVFSRARGRLVTMLTILPPGVPAGGIPVSLLLHGLNGNARYAAVGGMPTVLADLVSRGVVPPFAFVALDGGNNYWHEAHPGDDPMAMLLDEVPGWLAQRGLGARGVPFACTGVSMGGFGALLYGRRRAERRQPAQAIAAISPALLTSWTEMDKRHAFTDAAQWAALDPLRNLDKLGPQPIGVWVGDHDRFIDGTSRFIREVKPEVGVITSGAHNDALYRKVVPDAIRFLGRHVTPRPLTHHV